ncbi:uncharacterized protein [Hemitrygon akajei]|uniref:uncharacterized protein isoform X2 n=1 Tax=Hemitrygon akajei TaxID=2704970 RepID=UPI003BF9E365
MDDRKTYMNVNFTKTDSRFPSPAEPDVTYAELNVRTLSAARDRTDGDGLNSTYSELNFLKEEPHIDVNQDPPIASGAGGLTTTAHTGDQKQEPKQNIENRPDRKICLICLVTFALIAIVAGLSIYVSQTRQSLITSERNYQRLREQHHEMNRSQRQYQKQVYTLNSNLKSKTSENTRLDPYQRNCRQNLSALNNNLTILENNITVLNADLSELNRTYNDLRHQFNQLEMNHRNIKETKAQICQYLTMRREVCFQCCLSIRIILDWKMRRQECDL